ncbi:MAG: hypothetical protein Q8O88_01285 [bacterium]|nr:hypothetical protein [bacterium]
MSSGSYYYFVFSGGGADANSENIVADANIFGSFTNTILSDTYIQSANTIIADAVILGSFTNTIVADAFIGAVCLEPKLLKKTNGETLQAIEIRDGHSIALNNISQWFLNGIGSSLQKDLYNDRFSTDTVRFAQNVAHITGGSYQCVHYGSRFGVMIECGSLPTGSFNINDCNAQQISNGSYVVWGPNTSLGSSRAQVMKTLFYGINGTTPRIGSNFVNSITGIKVSTNQFLDVGRRAFLAKTVTVNATLDGGGVSTHTWTGSYEASSGSVWSWSRVLATASANCTHTSDWNNPVGTLLNRAQINNGTVISDETGSNLSADVKINPGSFSLVQQFSDSSATDTSTGSISTYLLTTGSVVFGVPVITGAWTIVGSSYIDFLVHHNVPIFGSFGTEHITTTAFLITQLIGIAGSVDAALLNYIGSFSSTTGIVGHISFDVGSNFISVCDNTLGSIGPNTGSLTTKIEIFRTGSTETDYINGIGVFHG